MDTKLIKQKILDLAIRGKLVPQNPADEPAFVLLERIKAEKAQLIKEGKIKKEKELTETDEPSFDIPNNWKWISMKDLCSKIGSGSTPRGSNYSDTGIPFFRSQNVYNEGLVYDDIKFISKETHSSMKGTEVIANDLLFNITGGSLGRCAKVPADFNVGNVSQHVCILRPILISSEYLHSFVISPSFQKNIVISGSGREGFPKYNMEKMLVPLPPLEEQKRIVTKIEELFAQLDKIEESLN